MRKHSVAILVLGAALFALGAAPAFARVTISASASSETVSYRHPAPVISTIRGRISTGARGVDVVLEAQRWPFSETFHRVAGTRTDRRGSYRFTARPTIATRYRVVAPRQNATSGVRTVYAEAGSEHVSCTISGNGQTQRCGNRVRAGRYTLRFSFDWIYPPEFFLSEIGLPVYFYYTQRNGSLRPPGTANFQRTVRQSPASGSLGHVIITQQINVPATPWAVAWAACLQTQERQTGFGPPGAPGSHHCGAASIKVAEIPRLG
ncbi:MAG: hypothetical protein ACR2JH_11680 [Solirubrobacteraceae bacterium]